MIIPLIAGFFALLGCFMVGGTIYCYKPLCCEDDEFVYMTSANRSIIDFNSD
jgi:hypothetical protein